MSAEWEFGRVELPDGRELRLMMTGEVFLTDIDEMIVGCVTMLCCLKIQMRAGEPKISASAGANKEGHDGRA